MTGADYIAQKIAGAGIEEVFVYPGGTIAPILDALRIQGVANFVSRHEQGAGYAAVARARITGEPQVVLVTSGPGATNLVTPVADAFFESTPLVVLTGQVGTGDLKGPSEIRQRGFQEVDTPSLMRPVTKAQFQPMSADDVPAAMDEAFRISREGRPGPVLVDLAMDVQRSDMANHVAPTDAVQESGPVPAEEEISKLVSWLAESSKPVIIAGQGVHLSNASAQLRALVEFGGGIPVAQSLLGLGAFPTDSPLSLGFHGHTGGQLASRAIHEADLVVAIGSRLDVRQTGNLVDSFVPNGRVVRIDIDKTELDNSRVHVELAILSDAKTALSSVVEKLGAASPADYSHWRSTVADWRDLYSFTWNEDGLLKPQQVILAANRASSGMKAVAVTGVGAHQQFVARHFDFDAPDRILLTSGGHGAMGYDVPTAMGAAVTLNDHLVLCFAGDGSFQMNIQELATIVEREIPVKMVVLDNRRLAMVSQFQNLNWGCDPTCGDKWNPDFAAIAKAYGIEATTVEDATQLDEAFRAAFEHEGPYLIHALVDPAEDVKPMLLANQRMDEMWGA